MKLKDTKWGKWVLGTLGAVIAGGAIMLGGVIVGNTAISQLVGLAVAQTSTLWNNVIDAAKGDAQTTGILGQSPYLYNGASFDRQRGSIANGALVDVTRISGSITPADAYTNPSTANQVWSLGGAYNGTTWDRIRTATGDGLASTGILASGNLIFNGTTFDRWKQATADGAAATGFPGVTLLLNNGTTLDRQYGVSGAINVAATSRGAVVSTPLSTWTTINTTSASATAASAVKASGGGTVRHVATGMTACNFDTATDTVRLVHLRDGASGAGTILKTWMLSVTVANGANCLNITGLNISGSAATAMTIEFASAPAGGTQSQTVSMQGYSTP